MSAASRRRKADLRRQARWHVRRARILEARRKAAASSALWVSLAFDVDPAVAFCFHDGDAVARKWCRHHPPPLPHNLGRAYRARRGRSW